MGDDKNPEAPRKKKEARLASFGCIRTTGPGLGLVVFANEDLGQTDGGWYCSRSDLVIDTERALKTVESELYKLLVKRLDLIPPLPRP